MKISGRGEPRVFKGYVFKEHTNFDDVLWTPDTVHLYQPGRAENPFMPPMTGEEFLGYATGGDHDINACILDYIESHPELYFEEWRKEVGALPGLRGSLRKVYACGSIFISPEGCRAIAGLYWDGEMRKLAKIFTDLDRHFFKNSFAMSTRFY